MSIDLNALEPHEIIELAYQLAEGIEGEPIEKIAGEDQDIDLNALSVDEFIEFASELEEELEKTAGVMDALKRAGKEAGRRFSSPREVYRHRAAALAEKGRLSGEGKFKSFARKMVAGAEAGAPHAGAAAAAGGAGYAGLKAYRNRKKGKGDR